MMLNKMRWIFSFFLLMSLDAMAAFTPMNLEPTQLPVLTDLGWISYDSMLALKSPMRIYENKAQPSAHIFLTAQIDQNKAGTIEQRTKASCSQLSKVYLNQNAKKNEVSFDKTMISHPLCHIVTYSNDQVMDQYFFVILKKDKRFQTNFLTWTGTATEYQKVQGLTTQLISLIGTSIQKVKK